jgi:hypothetical protein
MAGIGLPYLAFGLNHPRHKASDFSMHDSVSESKGRADYLNRECQCLSVDRQRMAAELFRWQGVGSGLLLRLLDERPQLFADLAVFVDGYSFRRQTDIIAAIEKVVALPGCCQGRALAWACGGPIRHPGPRGIPQLRFRLSGLKPQPMPVCARLT